VAARRTAAAALIGLACAGPSEPFRVVSSTPAPGDRVTGDTEIALRFSDAFDPETCTEHTVFVAWLSDDGHAATPIPVALRVPEVDLVLLRAERLWAGRWRLGVQTGPLGCQSQWGRSVAPFAADFQVEE